MSDVLETLKSQLGTLPGHDRAELAQFLINSLDSEVDQDAEAAWDRELTRRVAEIHAGRVVGEPADQVLAELRERFP